jgi:hypothetical protein
MPTNDVDHDALLRAFERFIATLEGTTVPVEGGRRVDGIAHAVALSEATDALYREIAAVLAAERSRNARPLTSYPAGVELQAADSPDGPWTTIPIEHARVSIAPIGGDGMNAVLLAALETIVRTAGFPRARWNAAQAARPGAAHQRWHCGDVVADEQLARLQAARRLLPLASDRTDDPEFRPASWFPKKIQARLRQAAVPGRLTKRVRWTVIEGVKHYSASDARRWWSEDVPEA